MKMKLPVLLRKIRIWIVVGSLCTLMQCSPGDTGRINIAGTPVSLVPPSGYVLAPEIGGFKHTSYTSSIMAVEVPRPFEEAVAELTEDKLSGQGIELLAREEVVIDDHAGVLCSTSRLSQGFNFRQWMLVLPYEQSTLTVNGTFLDNDEEKISETIRKALLSVKIAGSSAHEDVLPFQVEVTGLKKARVLPGPSVVYTSDGVWSEASLLQRSFFVGASVLPMPATAEELALGQFREACHSCELVENSVSAVTIDSLDGVEMWGYTPEKKKLKYELLLLDSNQVYLMIGTADRDHEKFLSLFKASGRSFVRK